MKLWCLLAIALCLRGQSGSFRIHSILHDIGEERWTLTRPGGELVLNSTIEESDRGRQRSSSAILRLTADSLPLSLEVKPAGVRIVVERPSAATCFPIAGATPVAVQAAMMQYWLGHGRPARLPTLRATPGAPPLAITRTGRDAIRVAGRTVTLERYNVANLVFGTEIVWMNGAGELAAVMTFAGGLPMEAVRTEYEAALPELHRSGVRQELANLSALAREAPAQRSGSFAIAGATLVDGTGAAPVKDAVVIVKGGRILAAGARAEVAIPAGMAVVDGTGQTLLPGLWEMHTHYSGVEFGPALLAAGVTTARDCGGEFDYLVAQRDAIQKHGALGPRLLLAGLVDAGGLKAFGHVTAETPEEGRAVVNRYHAAGFQQIKLYTYLTPEVVRAIAAEAHRLGMTVTGHVPQALNAFEGVEAGMDQINHLNYVTSMMRSAGEEKAIAFFHAHRTVVDPTAGWGEMAGHSKEVDVAKFEPGIRSAPFVLDAKFRGMGGNTTAEQMRARLAQTLAAIGALHRGGVTIVPGSDTGLVGHGLIRELELYVQAGMTPMEAVQCATVVSARAMHLEDDSGTVEKGKRADLILVDGDPLERISDLRKVSRVVANGRLYDARQLAAAAGFRK